LLRVSGENDGPALDSFIRHASFFSQFGPRVASSGTSVSGKYPLIRLVCSEEDLFISIIHRIGFLVHGIHGAANIVGVIRVVTLIVVRVE
jgi:hypothetical protein